jgi:hypothetical protein
MLGAIAPGANSGFSPFPIGIMPPFLEYQNAVMARAFFMHGSVARRVVSAMSNDEFNAQFKEGFTRLREWQKEQDGLDRKIFNDAMEDSRRMQELIIKEGVWVELEKIKGTIELWKSMPKAYWDAIAGNAVELGKIFGELTPEEAAVSSKGRYNPVTGEWEGSGSEPSGSSGSSGGHGTTIGGSRGGSTGTKKDDKPTEPNPKHIPFPDAPKGTPDDPLIDPEKRVMMDIIFKYPNLSRTSQIRERLKIEANMKDHAQNALNILRFPRSIPNVDKRLAKSYAYKTWFRKTYGFFPDSLEL